VKVVLHTKRESKEKHIIIRLVLTTSNAFIVVSSLLAATQPSSGEPPSHMPANAAMERAARRYMRRSPSSVMAGTHRKSSRSLSDSVTSGRYSGKRACVHVPRYWAWLKSTSSRSHRAGITKVGKSKIHSSHGLKVKCHQDRLNVNINIKEPCYLLICSISNLGWLALKSHCDTFLKTSCYCAYGNTFFQICPCC
jgi:hypothetical protein